MDSYLDNLATEGSNPASRGIDLASTEEILRIINAQDAGVAPAVAEAIPAITKAVDGIVERMKKGGHLYYFGCGTSGRLGVLDASECPPTYGVSPELVQGYIAGGDTALRTAVEGAEDDYDLGRSEIGKHGITALDTVVGISASGQAPYVLGAVDAAKEAGALTAGISTNRGSKLSAHVDIPIEAVVGNEVVTGSTRMKSGTAQKLVLNMLSTASMIRLGKVYGNLMVDVRATNSKLVHRAHRIFSEVTGAPEEEADRYLKAADWDTKTAILMYLTGLDRHAAEKKLAQNGGFLRKALEK